MDGMRNAVSTRAWACCRSLRLRLTRCPLLPHGAALRAGMAFTIGMRLFYLFIILVRLSVMLLHQ